MSEATIDILHESGTISELDYRFARFIGRLDGRDIPEVALAAALVSLRRGEGHICIDLAEFAGRTAAVSHNKPFAYPVFEEWLKILEQSPVAGRPGDYRPLILDGSLLYLYRYWNYEKNLSERLKNLAGAPLVEFDWADLLPVFQELFPDDGKAKDAGVNRQKMAAFAAIRNRLCVISGGPGTGKTYTVAKIIAALIQHHKAAPFRIALAAPTGKAAARLQESVKAAKTDLNCSDAVKQMIPEEASTIHRLLGSIPNSPYFRHNRENRLSADCVVIDEASMIDLALFSKLVDALKPNARLILLGDKDQLASVEAGAVLGDICDTGGRGHGFSRPFIDAYALATGDAVNLEASPADRSGIADCIVELTKSYRFSETSGIRTLSRLVNSGDADQTLDVIKKADAGDLVWKELPAPDRLSRFLEEWVIAQYGPCFRVADPVVALETQQQARILCALRDGPYGVHNINAAVERILMKAGLIKRPGKWYHGRPVMITRNDYNLRLFNGDVGIAMADNAQGGGLKVYFPASDGKERSFPPARLPDHETVFAMTVHKSQGSEFNNVLFVMTDRDAPILTRELIYTAITRARRRIEIWGAEDLLLTAVSRRIRRSSGLRQALWGASPE